MLKSEAMKHFRNGAAIGRALGIGRAAVQKWEKYVPAIHAAKLERITSGVLKFDPFSYPPPKRRRQYVPPK